MPLSTVRSRAVAPRSFARLPPRVGWAPAMLLLFTGATGCFDVSAVDPPEQHIWHATDIVAFEPEEGDPIPFVGSVAMLSSGGNTEVGFGIVGAEPDSVFGWRIRRGACSGAGTPLTTDPTIFPPVTTNAAGEGSVVVILIGTVSENETYAAEIYLGAADPELVGCGDMIPQ